MRTVALAGAVLRTSMLALCLLAPIRSLDAQGPQGVQSETITGTVKSDSGVAIANASITVTPAGGGFSVAVKARSNENGRWTATVPNRAPEYNVTVSAIGWVQQRTTAKSLGGSTPVVVDVTMQK